MYITECESDIVEEIETRLTESDEASAVTCNGPRKTSSSLLTQYVEDFCSEIGPTVEIPETPLDIFLLLFTPESLKHIEVESNRYAKQIMTSEEYDEWKPPIDVADLKAFLGFQILMGLNKLPSVDDYWK